MIIIKNGYQAWRVPDIFLYRLTGNNGVIYLDRILSVPETEEVGSTSNGNVLVAYFSWADNAILADDVDAVSSPSVIPPGNVQQLAGWVQEETGARQISVQFGENTVIYELNDSPVADSLYEQLPITTEVEDFSTNEKIFYPSQELDTSDSPAAEGGAGTLAYYAPWGDVVMFYDDYSANSSLFELGQAVSGGEQIGEMSGTIVIDIIDTADTEEYYTLIR